MLNLHHDKQQIVQYDIFSLTYDETVRYHEKLRYQQSHQDNVLSNYKLRHLDTYWPPLYYIISGVYHKIKLWTLDDYQMDGFFLSPLHLCHGERI